MELNANYQVNAGCFITDYQLCGRLASKDISHSTHLFGNCLPEGALLLERSHEDIMCSLHQQLEMGCIPGQEMVKKKCKVTAAIVYGLTQCSQGGDPRLLCRFYHKFIMDLQFLGRLICWFQAPLRGLWKGLYKVSC